MRLYLDHNSTTALRPEVREHWLELLDAGLGNASSVHDSGRRARAVVDNARERVAAALAVPEEWIVFTSGGTEANNAALFGCLDAAGPSAGLVIGAGEHSSVLEPARVAQANSRPLDFAPLDAHGAPLVADCLDLAARRECAFLSIMTANNEVGSVTPMEALADGLRELGEGRPVWHTDAVQALGRVALDLRGWGVDLASFSAHKLGGPLGVGILARNPQLPWAPRIVGGGQESSARAGTENAPGIGAAALALELSVSERQGYVEHTGALTRALWASLSERTEVQLVGPPIDSEARLSNTLNVRFPNTEGHALVARLDLEGLEASVGSACSSGALEPSHVLLAMGATERDARASLRLSVSRETSHKDIHSAVETLVKTSLAIRDA